MLNINVYSSTTISPKMMVKTGNVYFHFQWYLKVGTNPHLANVIGKMVRYYLRKVASLWRDAIISRYDLFYWPENEAKAEDGELSQRGKMQSPGFCHITEPWNLATVMCLPFNFLLWERIDLYIEFDFSIYLKIS